MQLHAEQAIGQHPDAWAGAVATSTLLPWGCGEEGCPCAAPAASLNVTASSNRCWTLFEALLGKIKEATGLLYHLDRSCLLLLQSFHDRAPMVLLSQGKEAEAERSGMLRARHEQEMHRFAP